MNVLGFGSAYLPDRPAYDLGAAQRIGAKAPPGTKAPSEPGQSQAPASDAEIKQFKDDLVAYRARQDTSGDYPAFQMMIPANERGYVPAPSADQQKLIDAITARHEQDAELRNPMIDMTKTALWKELTENGVNSDQIAKSAKYFYSPDGSIVDRKAATSGVDRLI
ncbi:hypothetical protein FQV39_30150 (plasmid) [Bosea sp. F3-2]|uniref:hypothetical protein n=1 Tax=Bosea sp. F3-2 TaxID=2599640 RepID=UPI0011ECAFB8|nr:hypothetical protein [Bosea sp. F3-2]QEL26921.1 hypothetical protein FQV39_30150 [Bosea sp. F3-2]